MIALLIFTLRVTVALLPSTSMRSVTSPTGFESFSSRLGVRIRPSVVMVNVTSSSHTYGISKYCLRSVPRRDMPHDSAKPTDGSFTRRYPERSATLTAGDVCCVEVTPLRSVSTLAEEVASVPFIVTVTSALRILVQGAKSIFRPPVTE